MLSQWMQSTDRRTSSTHWRGFLKIPWVSQHYSKSRAFLQQSKQYNQSISCSIQLFFLVIHLVFPSFYSYWISRWKLKDLIRLLLILIIPMTYSSLMLPYFHYYYCLPLHCFLVYLLLQITLLLFLRELKAYTDYSMFLDSQSYWTSISSI